MNYPEPTRETGADYQGYASQPYPQQQPYPPQQAPQMYPPPQQAPQMYPPPQQAPQMYPPPQQAPYSQPMQGYPQQQMQQQMYPGYAPYPQQMQGYMPPPPINVVVNTANTNVNENTAMPGLVYVRGVPFLVRILYFCFIGYWLGTCWAIVALACTALGAFGLIGEEIGEKMVRLITKMFFL